MIVEKVDDTRFSINLMDLYNVVLKTQIREKILGYSVTDFNKIKNHYCDLLFLTPTNLASNFYKTDFFISSFIIDGVKFRSNRSINGESLVSDITNIDSQVYFLFDE